MIRKIIRLMASIILRNIAENINDTIFYSIMGDEVADCSNKEKFIFCFRWVNKGFNTHEDFIGIYNVDNIKADTLATVIKGVLIRLNIPLSNARGQCYDGAKNIRGVSHIFFFFFFFQKNNFEQKCIVFYFHQKSQAIF